MGSRGSLSSGQSSLGNVKSTSSRKNSISGNANQIVLAKPRHPQLESKMKSVSLDSPDATPYTLNLGVRSKARSNRSASPKTRSNNNRLLSAPKLIKNCSIETDETDYTSASASPCPSPLNPGSISSLNNSPNGAETIGWVAIREYRQRFPQDLGLSPGDLVEIVDTSDPQWLHGMKPNDDHVGIFPVTCVAGVLMGERVAVCTQNLTLSHPPRQIKLIKDQILFTHGQPGLDKTIPIRTEKNYKATCPVQYLHFIT